MKVFWSVILALFLIPSILQGSETHPGKPLNILLIASGNKNLPAFKALESGLDQTLQFTSGSNNLFFEFLEGPQFFNEEAEDLFSAYLSEKFAHIQLDVVIGWVDQAAAFLQNHPQLFPSAMRLYLETGRPSKALSSSTDKRVYWIDVYNDIHANIGEMARIFPVERILVIGDSDSEGAQERRRMFDQAVAAELPSVRIEHLYDLPLDQLQKRLGSETSEKTAAYYLLMFGDGEGKPLTPYAVAHRLAAHSAIPIFSYWEALLGSGIVGGRLVSHKVLGEQIGRMLLSPEKLNTIIDISALQLVYDWNALSRWDIAPELLPEQATIINRPINILEKYKYYIWLTFLTITGLVIIVILLISILLIRKKTTAELTRAHDDLEEKVRIRTAELERANSFLEDERQRFFSILEVLPGFLYLQAKDYSIVFANKNFKTLFGEPGGRRCYGVIQGRTHPCEPCPTFNAFTTSEPQTWQWYREETGKMYQIYDYPFTDANGDTLVLEMGIDITEQKEAANKLRIESRERQTALERLRKSEEQYRTLVENSPDIIYRFSEKEGGFYVSPRVRDILGYKDAELAAEPFLWQHSIHPDDRPKVDEAIAAAKRGGGFSIEYRIRHKDGHWVWLQDRSVGLSGEGNDRIIEGIATDITELRETYQALMKSERNYRLIFNSAPIGIFRSTTNGRLLEANPQYAAIFGYRSVADLRAALKDNDLASTIYADPGDRNAFISSLRKHPQRWINFITRYRRKDGKRITCRTQYRSSTDANGREMIEGFVEDISDREKNERYLRHYESLVSAIDDMLAFVDTRFRYRQVNDAFVEAFGIKREEIIGKTVEQLVGAEFFEQAKSYYQQCFAGQKTVQELWTTFPQRTERYYRIIRYPMEDETTGEIYGIAIVISDMTDSQEIREKIARTNEELSRANEELDQFAYVVSHDLKSPLRAIHNYADFIQEDLGDTIDEDIQTYLQRMGKAVRRSEDLVEDLLEFSRIGRTDTTLEKIDLNLLFSEIIEDIRAGSDSTVIVEKQLPAIYSCRPYLIQIFQNLITNGLKFNTSSPRRVTISVDRDDNGVFTFMVEDNGIGISERFQEQIFKVFSRLHTSEEFEGTGIGLAIVRKAVDQLGGSISVVSDQGSGSTFIVTLADRPQESAEEVQQ